MSLRERRRHFFEIKPGSEVVADGRAYRVTHIISVDSVLAVDIASGESKRLLADAVRLAPRADDKAEVAQVPDLMLYPDEAWAEAQLRFQVIKPLLEEPLRSREDVEKIAATHGVHAATVYRWMSTYIDAGHISALVPSKRGRKEGRTTLDAELEAIIKSAIDDVYLVKQRGSPQKVIDEVQRRCRLAKLPAPHANTVRNRIGRLAGAHVLRRRGRADEARNLYEPVKGRFPDATHPLAVVQIDHTPADIICVDEVYRMPVARPYLTLAIDVFSRMVVGFYLSYDPPSGASVGMCLARAMCTKREYLAELGVPGTWPVWGRIRKVHCDNAKEFRGAMLRRACEEEVIDLEMRPVKTPHYGGHIERLMGTVAGEMHALPGTTFANPKQRKGYDSDKEAALTLRELETHLADFFVNVYHQRLHKGIGMPPIRRWEQGLAGDATVKGIGMIPLPADPERIWLNFMPYVERTVQPYGLQIDNISYYDPVLDQYINTLDEESGTRKNRPKRKFIVRRDPRDISRVYFYDPKASRYVPIPYRNLAHPPISLFELREVEKMLAAEGRKDVDEHLIFEAIERMRNRVQSSQAKSKAARKHAQRSAAPSPPPESASPKAQASRQTLPDSPSEAALPVYRYQAEPQGAEEDPFAEPVQLFENRESLR